MNRDYLIIAAVVLVVVIFFSVGILALSDRERGHDQIRDSCTETDLRVIQSKYGVTRVYDCSGVDL